MKDMMKILLGAVSAVALLTVFSMDNWTDWNWPTLTENVADCELRQFQGGILNLYGIKCNVLVDEVTISDVIVNRGNCPKDEWKPHTYKFGETVLVIINGWKCQPVEVEFVTNRFGGSATVNFSGTNPIVKG